MNTTEKLIAVRKARAELKREFNLFKAEMAELGPRLEALEAEKRGAPKPKSVPINDQIRITDGKISRW